MAHVLVVDDDPSVRALVRDVLELEGHDVELADDGYAALRAVAARRPDCVVLDVVMPGLDGHEVLALLRGRADGCELPVVMLTGAPTTSTPGAAGPAASTACSPSPSRPTSCCASSTGCRSPGADGPRC